MKRYLLLLLMLFIASLNFNLILKPLNLVTGGTQGVAIILNHLFKLSPSLIILGINILMLIISYFTLKKDATYGTVVATFIYPLFVKLTSNFNLIDISKFPIFLVLLITGFICGLTSGIVYKLGFSNGGISTLILVIKKYSRLSLAIINFLINAIIIIIGCYYFGFLKCFYSIIVILINSYLIKLILRNKK